MSLSEADRLIQTLGLQPHPEGGHFRETFRDHSPPRVREHAGGGDPRSWASAQRSGEGVKIDRPPRVREHAGGGDPRSWPSGQRSGEGDTTGRAASTAILFLLKAGEVSRWHRIDAAEIWHFYRGAPLELRIGKSITVLGPNIEGGESPQQIVPPGAWQMAKSLGAYTLVGCTVAPGFEFSGFEMAPDGFEP